MRIYPSSNADFTNVCLELWLVEISETNGGVVNEDGCESFLFSTQLPSCRRVFFFDKMKKTEWYAFALSLDEDEE